MKFLTVKKKLIIQNKNKENTFAESVVKCGKPSKIKALQTFDRMI